MAMPQEEIKKQQEQTASGGEGPDGWGFLMQYLLTRLDGMEANLRGDNQPGRRPAPGNE